MLLMNISGFISEVTSKFERMKHNLCLTFLCHPKIVTEFEANHCLTVFPDTPMLDISLPKGWRLQISTLPIFSPPKISLL